MGHIRIDSVDMILDLIRIEGHAVHVAGTDHQSGVQHLCESFSVTDGVEFHVQMIVADISEQQDRIDVISRPEGHRLGSASQSVLTVHHSMGDTLIGDGGGGILVGQLGHRSDGACSEILKRPVSNQPHRLITKVACIRSADEMIVEVVTESVGIVAIDRIRKNHEARKSIFADRNREGVGVEGHDRHATDITLQFIHKAIVTLFLPVHFNRESHVLLEHERVGGNHARSADNRNIVDAQLTIVRNIGDKRILVVVRSLEVDGVGHIDSAVLVVLRINNGIHGVVGTLDEATLIFRIRIKRYSRTLKFLKGEVVDGVMQQTVTDGVRITVAVGIKLDNLDTHAVVTGLTLLAHESDVQGVVVKHIQQIGAQMRLRNTAFCLSNKALTIIGHGEIAVVCDIGHCLINAITIFLGKFIVDVDRAGVLRILVAAGVHLHTDMVLDFGTHCQHIRNQLAFRKDGILDVEDGRVVRKKCNHTDLGMVGKVTDKAVRSHHRVVVQSEVINNPIESGLLELDVDPGAGVKCSQTDQSVLKSIFHREPASPGMQRVILRNGHTGRRIQFRNNNHVTVVVKHQSGGIPRGAVGGIGDVIVQVDIFATELPSVLLHQVKPVIGILGVVDDFVRILVGIQHQERKRTADDTSPEGVAEEFNDLDTVHIAAKLVCNFVETGGIPCHY